VLIFTVRLFLGNDVSNALLPPPPLFYRPFHALSNLTGPPTIFLKGVGFSTAIVFELLFDLLIHFLYVFFP